MPALAQRLNQDPSRYAEQGYCVFRDVVPAMDVLAARALLDSLIAASPNTRPEYLAEPHVKDVGWLELCRHPGVIDRVRTVLGDELILIMTHLIVKPARDGMRIDWHQDRPTWPSVVGTDIGTVWLAIDDADVENGCMRVIPRTHAGERTMNHGTGTGAVFDFSVTVSDAEATTALDVVLRAGDMSVHDGHLIHGSEANRSARRRAGFTMRYADPRTVTVDTATHWVPVYRVSGTHPSGDHYIDLRPGRPATIPTAAPKGAERPAGY